MKLEKQVMLTLEASRVWIDHAGSILKVPLRATVYFLVDDKKAINKVFKEFRHIMDNKKEIHVKSTIFK